ncbi:MAG: hypothetical protein QW165_02270 [Candidatus Woesearchaeota archaeon]
MEKRSLAFILSIALLLILAGCGGECKTAADCKGKPASAFKAECTDKKCVYTPIPNVCGNGKCETGEDRGNCEIDCGPCKGAVPGSKYLFYTKVGDKCLEDVEAGRIKPVYSTAEIPSGGDRFKIDTVYNQPFNLKRDTFGITITLGEQGAANRDERIVSAELTATTKDRRTITIARQTIDKYLWTAGSALKEDIILDFPTVELEGELSNLILKIQYEYSIIQAGKKTQKQGILQNRYKENFFFVKPSTAYPCPASCDDKNPGTRDFCGPQTNYFCRHEPIPNMCGNGKCDGAENKCTCPQDCGVCAGSAGTYLEYKCEGSMCVTQLKAGTTQQPSTLFDDRSIGPVQLNNNYKFKNPFNIKTDKFEFDFKIYRIDPAVSNVKIDTIRLLEGQEQITEVNVGKELSDKTTTVEATIPSIAEPEEEHNILLGVWYSYTQNNQEKQGSYQKPLGKITLINPG